VNAKRAIALIRIEGKPTPGVQQRGRLRGGEAARDGGPPTFPASRRHAANSTSVIMLPRRCLLQPWISGRTVNPPSRG
jgi:hypothetical protein